jgi:hypothetical protein
MGLARVNSRPYWLRFRAAQIEKKNLFDLVKNSINLVTQLI